MLKDLLAKPRFRLAPKNMFCFFMPLPSSSTEVWAETPTNAKKKRVIRQYFLIISLVSVKPTTIL
jgi:hypothetical protein